MPKNWEQREKKLDKRRNGMRVSGRSIFTIEEATAKRGEKAKEVKAWNKRKDKEA